MPPKIRRFGDFAPRSRTTHKRSAWTPFLTLLLGTAFAGAGAVEAADPMHRDIEFGRVDRHPLLLDIYQPEDGNGPRPLIIWVHGGAWRAGSKESVPIGRMLDHGFAIASVEYRLSPVAAFPAQIHDLKAAIRFLRANAGEYGFDAERFIIAGASAGGHLAALVGVSNGSGPLEGEVGECQGASSNIQATISFYGASNLQSILSQSTPHGLSVRVPALELLLGGLPDERPQAAKLASPVSHVDRGDPPLWLIHGDADPQMPFEQSRELEKVFEQLSLPVRFDVIPGAKHGGDVFYTNERLDRLADELKASLGINRKG